MAYTVKQLANTSGISVRTLHWYDKIGLLKPTYLGANDYRYYEKDKLLTLQQILFFKELGFALNDIQKLLLQDDFDTIKALETHRHILIKEINRKNTLLTTIDKTISHLKDQQTMNDAELYHGFVSSKQKEYQLYLVQKHKTKAEKLLKESQKRIAQWDLNKWNNVKKTNDQIHQQLLATLHSGLEPESITVQHTIHRHYQQQNRFYDQTKERYIGLTTVYTQNSDFRELFNSLHPQMLAYICKAMVYYAKKNL